jgi:hypothetical protein
MWLFIDSINSVAFFVTGPFFQVSTEPHGSQLWNSDMKNNLGSLHLIKHVCAILSFQIRVMYTRSEKLIIDNNMNL